MNCQPLDALLLLVAAVGVLMGMVCLRRER
jgi:hypothetical protein